MILASRAEARGDVRHPTMHPQAQTTRNYSAQMSLMLRSRYIIESTPQMTPGFYVISQKELGLTA